jgi:purine-binding chemotaxis protein CheW
VLSFLSADVQKKLADDFGEKLKGNGIAIVGQNEVLTNLDASGKWSEQSVGSVTIFNKK